MSDDQFTKLSKQIADMGEQFGEQFAKLYQHTERQFAELHAALDRKADASQVDAVLAALDAIERPATVLVGRRERCIVALAAAARTAEQAGDRARGVERDDRTRDAGAIRLARHAAGQANLGRGVIEKQRQRRLGRTSVFEGKVLADIRPSQCISRRSPLRNTSRFHPS